MPSPPRRYEPERLRTEPADRARRDLEQIHPAVVDAAFGVERAVTQSDRRGAGGARPRRSAAWTLRRLARRRRRRSSPRRTDRRADRACRRLRTAEARPSVSTPSTANSRPGMNDSTRSVSCAAVALDAHIGLRRAASRRRSNASTNSHALFDPDDAAAAGHRQRLDHGRIAQARARLARIVVERHRRETPAPADRPPRAAGGSRVCCGSPAPPRSDCPEARMLRSLARQS